MNIQEKIRAMVKHIQVKSDEELEKINEDARKHSDKIKEKYKKTAEERYAEIVAKAKEKAKQMMRKQSARSELEAGKMIMEARARILESAVDEVRKRAEEVISGQDYSSVLKKLIMEALETLDEKSVVLKANVKDRETIKEITSTLKKEIPNVKITVAEESTDIIGGITVESSSGRSIVVNTIAKKVEENREQAAFLLFEKLERTVKSSAKNR